MSRKLILLVIVLVGVLGLAWIVFGSKPRVEDRAWEQIQQSGVLRVGMDAAYPPFEDVNAENQIVGFDVDLANELGRRMGVEMQFINIAYDGLYDALLTGQVDILISALVAAPEFAGKANFSTPYFNLGDYLVVPLDSPIQQMDDLESHVLAVESGSGGDVEARKWERRLASLTVIRAADPGAALAAVLSGEADAALVDGVTARLGVGQHPELALAANVDESLIAAAVHPESGILLDRVNEVLDAMLADGAVSTLIETWFGPQRDR
jgi:polar amino acid transport system substrate-binding protein